MRHTTVFAGPTRRPAMALVAADLAAALALADALLDRGRPGLRLVCDAGLLPEAMGGTGQAHPHDWRTWRGAELLAEAPPGCACATPAFAAEARLTLPNRVSLALAGRVDGHTDGAPPLPSVPLYRVGFRPALHLAPMVQAPRR